MYRTLLIAGACLLALGAPADAITVKEFSKQFNNTPNSWERRALIQQLDPNDKDARKVIFFVLEESYKKVIKSKKGAVPTFDWYYRQGAIDVLAAAYSPETIAELEKIKPEKQPALAEGICAAFGKAKNKARLDYIIGCIKVNEKKVSGNKTAKKVGANICKQAAAMALRNFKDKRAVDELIAAWLQEDEDNFTVWIHYMESLEFLTRQRDLKGPVEWDDWWKANRETFEFPDTDAELSEEEKSGEMIATRVRGANLRLRSRGQGLPLLVLPAYGYEKGYLETYLRNLEDTNQILYLRLPGVADLCSDAKCTQEKCGHGPLPNAPGNPYPIYPLDRIGNALDGLFEELVKGGTIKGKFAVLAHGRLSCWVAMKFAEKYSRAIRRMILVGPYSSSKASSAGIDKIVKTGVARHDVELEHYGLSIQLVNGKPKYEGKNDEEKKALDRKGFTCQFGNVGSMEIARLYGPINYVQKTDGDQRFLMPEYARPMGTCIIPNDFGVMKLDKAKCRTPTMVMIGARSVQYNATDSLTILKQFKSSGKYQLIFRLGDMPFVEENELFTKKVRKFLGGKKKKKKKKKRKK